MAFLRGLLEVLDTQVNTPPAAYGLFHLISFAVAVLAGAGLCCWMKKPQPQQVRRVVLIISLVVILLEIYKQINYTFQVSGDQITAKYQWYVFP